MINFQDNVRFILICRSKAFANSLIAKCFDYNVQIKSVAQLKSSEVGQLQATLLFKFMLYRQLLR